MAFVARRPRVGQKIGLFDKFRSGKSVPELDVVSPVRIGATDHLENGVPNKLNPTGVQAHASLIEYITSNYYDRVMKIVIKDGYFCLAFCLGANRSWEEDWDDMVLELLDDDESCFIIYRLDEAKGRHFEHVLITWQPEDATVTDKASYTTSKAALINLFEDGTFTYNIQGSQDCDVDFNALKYIMMGEGEIQPLSKYEELKLVAEQEEEVARNRALKKIPDMDMPVDDDAAKEILKFTKGFINFVQFAIDAKSETIRVCDSRNITVKELPERMPEEVPRFNLYRYGHLKDGQTREYVPVFIYYVPEAGTGMSKRLYPCAIDNFIKKLQSFGVGIKLRLEFSDMNDMTEGLLYELIYPPDVSEVEKAFAAIQPKKRAGKRGGWVKVLPV